MVTKKDIVDYEKLLDLLGEYSSKLRSICDDADRSRTRLYLVAAVTLSISMLFALVIFFISEFMGSAVDTSISELNLSPKETYFRPVYGLFLVYAVFPIVGAFAVRFRGENHRRKREAQSLATALERLVALLSQHSDTSSDIRLNERILSELRLSEAESSLSIYRNVFGISHNDRFEYFPVE